MATGTRNSPYVKGHTRSMKCEMFLTRRATIILSGRATFHASGKLHAHWARYCSDDFYRELPCSKVSRITGYPNYVFRGFPVSPVDSEYQKSVKRKVIPLHILKAQKGNGGIAPIIINLGNR